MPARLADNEVKNEQTVAYPLDPTLGKMLRRVFAFGSGKGGEFSASSRSEDHGREALEMSAEKEK